MPSATTSALFTPIKIGQHLLKHRVVLPPMTRMRADDHGNPTEQYAEYYKQRATPGGLLLTEATAISPSAGAFPHTAGIYTNDQIAAWKKVTDAVHEKGGIIFVQIWHGGRASFSFLLPDNQSTVSASDIAIEGNSPFGAPYEKPRALEVEEIKSIIQDFVQAAKNAIAAGFDGVEIHGANGFLVDQFINTSSNKRTDQYGGSIENRTRFALEVVDATTKAIGDDKTAIRLSPWGGFHDMKDDTALATWSYITEQLEKKHPHLAYLHFIEARSDPMTDTPTELKEGEKTETLDPFRALWSGPFISAGNYTYDMKSVFDRAESSPNNLVAIGRAFIANPDLVERLRNNWKLNPYDRATFYTSGPEGYTDYPFYDAKN
ncbi:uncharacterized protein BX664DRAFT_290598 [Halteromyces radiatus]|uniref:uncharacterized protein n=1 Tax=Halteromyces radiatus TaxID=101107 RepID=UPI0022211BC5|nr:uncharacterized protein BX664DRAFT_290598 [Halteromyces radiatus]KAI8100087.1 hypothetical protein BX664DRAFT_290598 [Halteromyces radiatus]